MIAANIKPAPIGSTELQHVEALEKQLPTTEVVRGQWFTYNEATGCWDDGDKDDYKPLALAIMHHLKRKVAAAHRILDHMEDRWRCKSRFWGAIKPIDLNTIQINVANGVITVTPDDIVLSKHSKEHRFTRALAVPYIAGATNPLYDTIRRQILSDPEDERLFQLICANAFIPDARFEVSGVIHGEAGCGKDTLLTPYISLFGDPAHGLMTNLSLTQICDPKSYSLPKIQFACVNLCTELNNFAVEDSSTYKMLVSGSPIPAREIYKRPFDMLTHCKLISLSNNMPRFKDGTSAEIRRMRFIRCEFQPKEVDVTLKEKLRPACPGVLNYFLAGVQALLKLGTKVMPYGGKRSREMHARFDIGNDPVGSFLKLHCELGPEHRINKEDLRVAFNAFADEHSLHRALKGDTFFKKLYEREPKLEKLRARTEAGRQHVVVGIRLTASGLNLMDAGREDEKRAGNPLGLDIK